MRGSALVNGETREISGDDEISLLEVLRGDLGLLGTKFACGEGTCGACTVMIGREAVPACQVPAQSVIGRQVTTVEGLAEDGILHPVQQAFLELGALQRGYCTAGWIVEAASLLARDQDPSDAQIVAALDGHLCRCGTYRMRPFFEHLGEGLVVAVEAPRDAAPEERWTTARTAWLHVGPSGKVTAFTGKVELGQGTRTGLGVDERRVRIVVPDFGGGFGGRQRLSISLEAARLARAVGRPVKVQWNRWEELMANHFRPAAVIDVESAVDATGVLSAWSFTNINSGPAGIATPYRVPNRHISYVPAASPLPQGPYRALAATANHFARESHMDEVAHRLGLDPLKWRLAHIDDDRLAHVLRVAAERIGWSGSTPPEAGGSGLGVGLACGTEKGSRVATAAAVVVDAAGSLHVTKLVSVFDAGRVVSPGNLANQVEGAALTGLGGALFEAVEYLAGRIDNASFSTYWLPRLSDLPKIEVVLVDRRELEPAGGGETPIVAVAAAIANAIFAATGVRLRSLPLRPDGIVVRS